jgi:hypothetical protein
MRQPRPSQTVLVLANPSKRVYGHVTHAPDCRWVKGVTLALRGGARVVGAVFDGPLQPLWRWEMSAPAISASATLLGWN